MDQCSNELVDVQVMGPLVHERDVYLAWSCKRSKAVNGTRRVVGVVGRGHLRGVVYALTSDQGQLRFKDLVGRGGGDEEGGSAGQQQWRGVARRLGAEVLLAAVGYWLWVVATSGAADGG